jgi:hypothetical protein
MRTTINLDDDILERLKDYAEDRSVALGKAASELMRKGLETPLQTRLVNGVHTVVLPPHSPKISSERIKDLLEDEV